MFTKGLKIVFGFVKYVMVLIITVITLLMALLSNSYVQQYVGDKFAGYLSSKSGLKVSIGKLGIGRFLSVDIRNLYVEDHHGVAMFDIGELSVGGIHYNPLNKNIGVGRVELSNSEVNLVQYVNDSVLNIDYLIKVFESNNPDTTNTSLPEISVGRILLNDVDFRFQNENETIETKSMDYANIRVKDIYIDLSDVKIDDGAFDFKMNSLSAVERCGLYVKKLAGDFKLSDKYLIVKDMKLITPYSDVDLDFSFSYDSWRAYVDFINKMKIDANVRKSKLNLSDIGRFAEGLYGMNNLLDIEVKAEGTVNNLYADIKELYLGKNTFFEGDVIIDGLPDISNCFFDLRIKNFNTTVEDLKNISLGNGKYLGSVFSIPSFVENIDMAFLHGSFVGKFNDFSSDISLTTNLGDINANLTYYFDEFGRQVYNAGVVASDLNVGRIFNIKDIGKTSFKANVKGSGTESTTINANGDVNFDYISFMDYRYKNINIKVNGLKEVFSTGISINDENLKLEIDGSIDMSVPEYLTEISLSLNKAVLNKLNLIGKPSDTADISLSTNLKLQAVGDDIYESLAFIDIDSLKYGVGDRLVAMDKFLLISSKIDDETKNIKVRSDYINAELNGKVKFKSLPLSVKNILDNSLFKLITGDSTKIEMVSDVQDFSFSIDIKKIQPVLDFFVPGVVVNKDIHIEGSVKSEDEFIYLYVNTPSVGYGGFDLVNTNISIDTKDRYLLSCRIFTDSIKLYDSKKASIVLFSSKFNLNARNDTLRYSIDWFGNDTLNDIKGLVSFKNYPDILIKITDSYVSGMEGGTWRFNPLSTVSIKNGEIFISNLDVSNSKESIKIGGSIAKDSTSRMRVELDSFSVSNLDFITKSRGIDVNGIVNGYFELMDPYGKPRFDSDIDILGASFNQESLGDIGIMIEYNPLEQLIEVAVNSTINRDGFKFNPISIHGFYYPTKEKNNFDISCKIQNFRISTFSSFVDGILSDLSGFATGEFKIKGSLKEPDITGNIKFQDARLRVDFLNTLYTFSDEFIVNNESLVLKDVKISDTTGHVAVVNGKITHHNLKDFYLDIGLKADNFIVLFTERSLKSSFYGSAIATGEVKVTGPADDILISAKVKTDRGTDIYIPISSTSTVEDSYFVIFIDPDKVVDSSGLDDVVPVPAGFALDFDLNVNPDTKISVIIPGGLGNLAVKGTGDLNLGLDRFGNFSLDGDYKVSSGTFTLNIEDIYGKQLDIRNGSKIAFRGDPADAQINIATYYKTRMSLAGLNLIDSTLNNYRTEVYATIYLKDKLMNPQLWFSIYFPGVSEELKQEIYTKLDTTNQALITQQVFAVMLFNNFTIASSNSDLSSTLTSVPIDFVTGQLNNLLSSFSNNLDIGINYRPGDHAAGTASEYEVALSTNFFNDRLEVSGNFGVRDNGNISESSASQIVGDVLVSYKITKEGNVKIIGYNQTNNTNLMETTSQYTQGVGISLSKSFNGLKGLFEKDKNKKKEKKRSRVNKEAIINEENGVEEGK